MSGDRGDDGSASPVSMQRGRQRFPVLKASRGGHRGHAVASESEVQLLAGGEARLRSSGANLGNLRSPTAADTDTGCSLGPRDGLRRDIQLRGSLVAKCRK